MQDGSGELRAEGSQSLAARFAVSRAGAGGDYTYDRSGESGGRSLASSLGISTAEFIENREVTPTAEDVAHAVVECASNPQERAGKAFLVSGAGVKLVS